MTSALGKRGALVEFEDSQLFLQIVIVISIFYALFPLQVHLSVIWVLLMIITETQISIERSSGWATN